MQSSGCEKNGSISSFEKPLAASSDVTKSLPSTADIQVNTQLLRLETITATESRVWIWFPLMWLAAACYVELACPSVCVCAENHAVHQSNGRACSNWSSGLSSHQRVFARNRADRAEQEFCYHASGNVRDSAGQPAAYVCGLGHGSRDIISQQDGVVNTTPSRGSGAASLLPMTRHHTCVPPGYPARQCGNPPTRAPQPQPAADYRHSCRPLCYAPVSRR